MLICLPNTPDFSLDVCLCLTCQGRYSERILAGRGKSERASEVDFGLTLDLTFIFSAAVFGTELFSKSDIWIATLRFPVIKLFGSPSAEPRHVA